MNRNYRLIFNRSLGILQVGSEHARSRGKTTAGPRTVRRRLAALVAMTLLAGTSGLPAWATTTALSTKTGASGGNGGNSTSPNGTSVPGTGGSGTAPSGSPYANAGGNGGSGGSSGTTGGPGGGGYGAGGRGGNSNSIAAGGGGGGGGAPAYDNLISGTSYTIASGVTVSGGTGGSGGQNSPYYTPETLGAQGSYGGNGGTGIYGGNWTLTNSGTITGGSGGGGGIGGIGGIGGAGVSGSGFTLTNSGTITGGSGGPGGPGGPGGFGGAAVISTGSSTIVEDGSSTKTATLQGGLPFGSPSGSTNYADAIQFSGGGNTLTLDNPYYSILGNVISTSGTTNGGDTLELAGTASSAAVTGTFSNSATSSTPYSATSSTPYSASSGPLYSGFTNLVKTGTGTWSISPTAISIPNWTIDQGILSVQGNYDPSASNSLSIAITPQDSTPGVDYGQLQVQGSATLNGSLKILDMTQLVTGSSGGTYSNAVYDLITTTSGVSGNFTSVAYDPNFASYITPSVSTSGKNEVLTLTAAPAPAPAPAPGLAFTTGDAAVNNETTTQLSLSNALGTVLDGSQALPGRHVSLHFTATRIGSWAKGFGGFGRSNGNNIQDFGGVVGYGSNITRHLTLGAAFSGLGTSTQSPYETASGKSFGIYGYGIYTQNHLRISGTIGAGYLDLNTHRNLYPTTLQAYGSTNGWFLGTGIQAQYLIPLGQAFLIPYGRLSYLHTTTNAFTEHGAGLLDLTIGTMHTNIVSLTGGMRAGVDLRSGPITWVPWAEVGGTGNAGNRHSAVLQTLLGLGGETNVARSLVTPAGSLDVGAGLTVHGTGPWTIKIAYQGQFAGNIHYNTFGLLANYRW
jgi:hypothetical protein